MLRLKQIIDPNNLNASAGFFDDLADLKATVTVARMGDYAIIGKQTDISGGQTGTLYFYNSKDWVTYGGSEVVYKAAAAVSEINKVNAYTKLADVGAGPSAKKGAVYSTFTLDTGTLSSYIAKEDGSGWVSIASAVAPGVYVGFATTFAALPTTRRDSSVLVAGDLAFLTVDDGTNKAGAYRLVGTTWTFDFSLASTTIPTVQAGLATATTIETLTRPSNVHINGTTTATTWNVGSVVDGVWHYVMNVGTVAADLTFTGHTKVYLRSGKANDELTAGKLTLAPGEAYFVHVTNNAGSKYVNISKFGGGSVTEVVALATGGTPKAGAISIQGSTDTFVKPTLTSGQKAAVLKFDSNGEVTAQTHWYHDGTKQYELVGVARTDLITLTQTELDGATSTKAGQVTGLLVQKAIETRLLRKTYTDKAARDADDTNIKIGHVVKVDDVWQQKTAASTYEEIARPGIPKNGVLTKDAVLTEYGIYGFDGKGDAAAAPLDAHPAGDMGVESFNNTAGWGSFTVGFDPLSGYGLLEAGKTVRKVRVRSLLASGHIQAVRLYSDVSATTLDANSAVTNMVTLANNVFEYDLVTPIQISSQTQMLAVTLGTTVFTDSRAGFTDRWGANTGAPTSVQSNTRTAVQFMLDGAVVPPSVFTLPSAATVKTNSPLIFHEIANSSLAGAVLKPISGQTINGAVDGSFDMKDASGIYIAVSDGADGYAVKALGSSSAKVEIPTTQAGLGTAVAIESIKEPNNVHLNSASGAVTWDVKDITDGTWHYVMNVGAEAAEVSFSNHTKIYLRNGVQENEITTSKLETKPGDTYLVHVTNNAGAMYVNIVPFGGGTGLKQNGSLTANKTLTDSGLYAFPGDGVGSPTKARLEITLPKAATIGKNAPFFFHETSDSITFGALLRTAAGEKTNGVLNSPYLMRAASGIWVAISNGVDGYSVAPLADDGVMPTFQVGLGVPFAIDKIDGAKAIHLNSASGAVSWDVANAVDGTWRYIMNVAAQDVEVTFTNHFKLYARNGVLNNELADGKLLTRPGETYFVHLTNNSDNIYVNVMSLGTATGMKRCGVLNADKTLREPGVYGFSGATGAAIVITLDEAPLVGENQIFMFHEVLDKSDRAVTLKPKTGQKINGTVDSTVTLRGASGVWMAVCNGVDGYNVLQVGGSLVPTVQAGLGTAVAIETLDCGRAVHLNSKTGAVTWNVANGVDGTWQYVINTSATDDVDVTFLGHHKIYLRDGVKNNEVTASQLKTKPGEWYIVHLTNNAGQVFVNIGKMFNRGPQSFKGLQLIAEHRPATAVDIESSNLIATGLDLRTADQLWMILQSSSTMTFAGSATVYPVFANYIIDLKRLRNIDGVAWLPQESGKTYIRVVDWEKGDIKFEDADQGSQFVACQTWGEGTNGWVVPTGTTVGEECDVKVNGTSIGKAYTGTTTRLTVTPAAGKMIQSITVPDATQGTAVYADPYTGELSVTPKPQKTTMDITVVYTDINRQSYSFAAFRTDSSTINIAVGSSPTWTATRWNVNEVNGTTANAIIGSGSGTKIIVPRTGRVLVESKWFNTGSGDQRITLRHEASDGTVIADYANALSVNSNIGYSAIPVYATKGDRFSWIAAGAAASSIFWAEHHSELRLTSIDDTGKGFVVPTATTARDQVTVTANAGALLVNGVSSVPGFTGTSMRLSVPVPNGQILATVSCATAGVTVTSADNLRGAIELALPTGITGTVDITVTFATLGASKVLQAANSGVDISCGTLKWRLAGSGNRSLQVSTVSGGTVSLDVFTCHDSGGKTDGTFSMTANATPAYIMSTWSFGGAGNWQRVVVHDKTNGRWYDITMIIGTSYSNNSFTIIEQL